MMEDVKSQTELFFLSKEVADILESTISINFCNIQFVREANLYLKRLENTCISEGDRDVAFNLFKTHVLTSISDADQLFLIKLEDELCENARNLRNVLRTAALRASGGNFLTSDLLSQLDGCRYALKRSLGDYLANQQVALARGKNVKGAVQ